MELTTRFELQSQATRLEGRVRLAGGGGAAYGALTLSCALRCASARRFPPVVARPRTTIRDSRDFHLGHFPLHSPLLGESSLVSFPPLSNMLKFSGSSCLTNGALRFRFSTGGGLLRAGAGGRGYRSGAGARRAPPRGGTEPKGPRGPIG
jgi:hypothetical protein